MSRGERVRLPSSSPPNTRHMHERLCISLSNRAPGHASGEGGVSPFSQRTRTWFHHPARVAIYLVVCTSRTTTLQMMLLAQRSFLPFPCAFITRILTARELTPQRKHGRLTGFYASSRIHIVNFNRTRTYTAKGTRVASAKKKPPKVTHRPTDCSLVLDGTCLVRAAQLYDTVHAHR